MASCQTTQWGSYSPYIKLTVTQKSATESAVTLSWVLEYIADYAAETKNKKTYSAKVAGKEVASGSYDINGKTGTNTIDSGEIVVNKTTATQSVAFSLSFDYNGSWSGVYKGTLTASGSISVASKVSYTIQYNLNGGSGTFANQTKYHAVALTIHSGNPTKSGYTFEGWALSNGGSVYYKPGSQCGRNENLTLYAVWSSTDYKITYNANGGTGAPGIQTNPTTISSTKPTRSGYVFEGWSIAANSTDVIYNPDDAYSKSTSITLYAVWKAEYAPIVTNFTAIRCDENGNIDPEGTYVSVEVDVDVCENQCTYLLYSYINGSDTAYTTQLTPLPSTTGHIQKILGSTTKPFNVDENYVIKIRVTDSHGVTEVTTDLIDTEDVPHSLEFMPEDKGVFFPKAVQGNVVGLSDLVAMESNDDANKYLEPGAYSIATNAIAATISNIPADPDKVAGRFFVAKTVGRDGDSNYRYRTQIYIPYVTTRPIRIRNITKNNTNTWSYGTWKTLALPTKDITFTPNTGVTVTRCTVSINNDIATMCFSGKYNAAIATSVTAQKIGSISTGFPTKSVVTCGLQGSGVAACWVTNAGVINIRPVGTAYVANSVIEFNLTWNVEATWS